MQLVSRKQSKLGGVQGGVANFNVHLSTAIVGGVALANAGWAAGLWTGQHMLTVIFLTTVGGLIPDIDQSNSHSVRLLFNLLGLIGMVLSSTLLHGYYPFWLLMLLSIGVHFMVRYGVAMLFLAYSVHRGNCHSLAATAFAGIITATAAYQLTGDPVLSWSYAGALMFGVLIHLGLDEVYSVDFAGTRIKKSFGTALKPISKSAPIAGLGLVLGSLFCLHLFAPPLTDALTLIHFVRSQLPF